MSFQTVLIATKNAKIRNGRPKAPVGLKLYMNPVVTYFTASVGFTKDSMVRVKSAAERTPERLQTGLPF